MDDAPNYPKIAQLRDVAALRARLATLGLSLPIDERVLSAADGSPLAAPIRVGSCEVANRWCIHAMEGWDANTDGSPSEHTLRRWRNFGLSGAKLIWGGEAAAVRPDGRANPNQTMAVASNRAGLQALLDGLHAAHREAFGSLDGLLVGLAAHALRPLLQAARSPEIRAADGLSSPAARRQVSASTRAIRRSCSPTPSWTSLLTAYVAAARLAAEVGFQFVDVKACHGYLLHELLSARRRPGKYGGDLAGRSRLLLSIIDRIRDELPRLIVGVRLSVFDSVPFASGRQLGRPMDYDKLLPYEFGFGVSADDPLPIDLTEPLELMRRLVEHGVAIVNLTCGSPYYNPHMQRPAIFPPTDGYLPPEDPLVGVCAADSRGPRLQTRITKPAAGRHGLLVPAGISAERGTSRGPRGLGRFRRPRADGALLPRAAGRHARRPVADAKENLPHVQRLHDRAPQRPDLRLLPARPALQGPARARRSSWRSNSSGKSDTWRHRFEGAFPPLFDLSAIYLSSLTHF